MNQREKDDHRLAFALGMIEEFCRMIAGSNGMQTKGTTDSERFYVKLEDSEAVRTSKIEAMFNSIAALAKAQQNAAND